MRWRRTLFTFLSAVASLVLATTSVPAQIVAIAPGAASPASGPLSRFRFHLDAGRLTVDDPLMQWDADFGGDVDLVDYRTGRATFLANYEVIVGDERRAFDPVQANYTLDLSVSYRMPAGELFGVFHHVSRHLSDRAKPAPIDWNMLGVRFMRPFGRGRVSGLGAAHALFTVQHSLVDYDAEYGVESRIDLRLGARHGLFTEGSFHGFQVDASIAGRERQVGGRLEGGVRLTGGDATVELVVGVERRVDPDPLRFGTRNWAVVGFRLLHP